MCENYLTEFTRRHTLEGRVLGSGWEPLIIFLHSGVFAFALIQIIVDWAEFIMLLARDDKLYPIENGLCQNNNY